MSWIKPARTPYSAKRVTPRLHQLEISSCTTIAASERTSSTYTYTYNTHRTDKHSTLQQAMIQLLTAIPQHILDLEGMPENIRHQKWQQLAKKIFEATNDNDCDKAYEESPELLRGVVDGLTAGFDFPPDEMADETHQETLNKELLHDKMMTVFSGEGRLYVTSRCLLFARPSGAVISFEYRSLMLHAVPRMDDGSHRLLCHFETSEFKDADGNDIPLYDHEAVQASTDLDYAPYFEFFLTAPPHSSPSATSAATDDSTSSVNVVSELYNAIMDATMLAGYCPSMADELFNDNVKCCMSKKGEACCPSMACCDEEDETDGACCRDADLGCCAAEKC